MKNFLFNKINVLFLTLLIVSFSFHIINRSNHFQEVDSTMIYQTTRDFMSMAMSRFNGTFLDGSDHNKILTKNFVASVIDKPQISLLLNNIFQGEYTQESKEKIIDSLEKISFLGYLRMGLSFLAYKFSFLLPGISDGLKVALTSTNSFGPSVIYGIVSLGVNDYDDFMSRILIVTILLFHLSVLLLYLVLLKLKIRNPVALFTSLMMLFSISLYSYGYHQGSTIWNLFTMMLFFYYSVYHNENKNFFKNISKLVAVLVFFNYLIIFPRFALMIQKLYLDSFDLKIKLDTWNLIKDKMFIIFKNIRSIIKDQKIALICIFICGLLFYEPTATKYLALARESEEGLMQIFINFYYIILNFVSMYAGNKRIDIGTFVISTGFIVFGYIFIFNNQVKHSKWINLYLKILIGIMFVVFTYGVLIFIPSRHILWLALLVFIPIAITIDLIIDFLPKYKNIWVVFFTIFIGVGFFTVFDRSLKTIDIGLTLNPSFTASYDEIIILDVYGSKFGYTNKYKFLEETDMIRHFIHPTLNFFSLVSLSAMEKGKKYFYVSQTNHFSSRLQERGIKDIKYKTYNENKYYSDIYFIANNKGSGSPYSHTFPNALYIGEFELLK